MFANSLGMGSNGETNFGIFLLIMFCLIMIIALLNILIADQKSNSMFQLVQDPLGKVICTVMSDGRKQSVSAKNAKLLYENHAAFLKEFAFPVMIRFGIQTDESFGGPHKISNAAKPTKKNRGR